MCDEKQSATQIETDETNSHLSLTDLPIEVRINKYTYTFAILIQEKKYTFYKYVHYKLTIFQVIFKHFKFF